jgi:hypothetical protein
LVIAKIERNNKRKQQKMKLLNLFLKIDNLIINGFIVIVPMRFQGCFLTNSVPQIQLGWLAFIS